MRELGSRLVRAREARGLTLEDAERDTRISRRYLQALESEQFEAIPAPVYARGFLRSYSQYLGLDPQELLALFPRDRDQPEPVQAPARASVREPLSAVGPSRPSWRKEPPPAGGRQPAGPQGAGNGRRQEYDTGFDDGPVIGVDIGMPSPARRIQPDPAAQTRTTVVIVIAVAAVIFVSLLAFAISRLGGDEAEPGSSNDAGGTGVATDASATGTASGAGTSAAAGTSPAAEIPGVVRGTVPDVGGMAAASAKAAIEAAGFQAKELPAPHSEPKNTVYDQSPAPGGQLPEGSVVTIAVSTGPE